MTRSGDAGPAQAPGGAGRATLRTSAPADPLGKRALFAPPDLRSGAAVAPAGIGGSQAGTEADVRLPASEPFTPSSRGRRAWFSEATPSGPAVAEGAASPSGLQEAVTAHPAGVVATIACSSCGARTSLGLIAIATRLATSVWIPGRRWSRYLRCPACGRRAWCRVRCAGSAPETGHMCD